MENARQRLRSPARMGASLALFALQATLFHAAADPASPIQPYYDFVYWTSVNRTDLALAQFAEDAVVVAGPDCTQAAPCIGKESIRTGYVGALAGKQIALPLSDQRFDGQRLRTRGESIFVAAPQGRVMQLRGGHVFEFRDGRIASLRVELDTSDPQTAEYIARQAVAAAIARR